jgi:hypothetical protein
VWLFPHLLLLKNASFTFNLSNVQAWFMDRWFKTKGFDDFVAVFLPESWGFRVGMTSSSLIGWRPRAIHHSLNARSGWM